MQATLRAVTPSFSFPSWGAQQMSRNGTQLCLTSRYTASGEAAVVQRRGVDAAGDLHLIPTEYQWFQALSVPLPLPVTPSPGGASRSTKSGVAVPPSLCARDLPSLVKVLGSQCDPCKRPPAGC